MKVWKYVFAQDAIGLTIEVPSSADIIHVGLDPASERVALWLRVDPEAKKRKREFFITGTGTNFSELWQHVGSVRDGMFMWHVFEDVFERV